MENNSGSELHRLKEMGEYNTAMFNRLYRKLKPLVRKLSYCVDARRYNVSPDIIQSYFWDKFLYVFNRYQSEYDENRLKATLISSLTTFKNRLLRKAYSEQSEYYQSLVSLDELFDDSKEDIIDDDDTKLVKERYDKVDKYLRDNLSPDAYLLFGIQLDPPPYIRSRMKTDDSKISIMMILDFLNLKRTKSNANYISSLRKEIEFYKERAREELK